MKDESRTSKEAASSGLENKNKFSQEVAGVGNPDTHSGWL